MSKNTDHTSTFRGFRRRSAGVVIGALTVSVALLLQGCAPAEEPQNNEDITLTFMNQSRGQEAALNQLAEQYTEETGVTIVVDSPGPADYLPKLQASAQSNSMPDIYSSFSANDMSAFYKAGWAMDLTEELDGGWKDDFSPTIIELSKFEEGNNLGVKPGIYTVHWETQTYGFLVNPALSGIAIEDVPKTFDEFVETLAGANTGSGNFQVAASLTPQLLQGLVSNWLTDEEIEATFNGDRSWEDDAWKNALEAFLQFKDAGVIANGALPGGQDDNPNVETAFFTQTLGSVWDASPGVSVGLRTNPEFEDYFSIGLLPVDGGDLDPRSPGIPGKGAVINPKGDHPEAALEFVKWLTEPEQQAVFAEVGRILPSNPELLASGDVPQQLTGYADGVETMQLFSAVPTPDVKTAIVAEVQRLVLGEASIDEVLANVQAAQDRTP